VIGTLAVDGWAFTFGTARSDLGGLRRSPVSPRCTKRNSPPINIQCANFVLSLFNVALYLPLHYKGLIELVTTNYVQRRCSLCDALVFDVVCFIGSFAKKSIDKLLGSRKFLKARL